MLAPVAYTQDRIYSGGSHFECGFARLEIPGSDLDSDTVPVAPKTSSDTSATNLVYDLAPDKTVSVYMDTSGQVAFDEIIRGRFSANSHQADAVGQADRDPDSTEGLRSGNDYVLVRKGRKVGLLTTFGAWVLKPVYDFIDTRFRNSWIVGKNGRQSLFTAEGLQLPFLYDTVYQMDEHYFQVVKDGKWGIYSKKDKRLVVPCIYQNMDYCYGCTSKGTYCFAQKKGKWGVIDFKNQVLLPFAYDHHHRQMRSDEWVLCLYKGGQQMSINLKTKQRKPYKPAGQKQRDTTLLADGFLRVRNDSLYGLINAKGTKILDEVYDYIRYEADTSGPELPMPFVAINKGDRWGVTDTTGKVLIRPRFSSALMRVADSFFIGENRVQHHYDNVLLSRQGEQVLPGSYEQIRLDYKESGNVSEKKIPFFRLKKDHKYGFYNPQTKALMEPVYDDLSTYTFDIASSYFIMIKQGDKRGLADVRTGKIVVPPVYDRIWNNTLPEGLVFVRLDDHTGLFDFQKQKMRLPVQYVGLKGMDGHTFLRLYKGDGYGLMDYHGKQVVAPVYASIQNLNDSLLLLTSRGGDAGYTYRFFDTKKRRVTTSRFDAVTSVCADTLAIVLDEGKEKLWNPTTGQILDGAYARGGYPDRIDDFNGHYAIAYKDNKAGMIDDKGNVIIKLQYDGLSNFYKGYALVFKNNDQMAVGSRYGFIDSTGQVIIPVKYVYDESKPVSDYITPDYLVLYKQQTDGGLPQQGLANRSGVVIIPPVYDAIHPQKGGQHFVVVKNHKFGIVSAVDREILPPVFDDLALDERPLYEDEFKFSFPILARKGSVWQYYRRDGTPLPVKTKGMIRFSTSSFF